MTNLIKATKIDFLGKRADRDHLFAPHHALSIGYLRCAEQRNFGVDFVGGDRLVLAAQQKPNDGEVRYVSREIGLGEVVVQIEKSPTRISSTIRSPKDTGEKIWSQLRIKFPRRSSRGATREVGGRGQGARD